MLVHTQRFRRPPSSRPIPSTFQALRIHTLTSHSKTGLYHPSPSPCGKVDLVQAVPLSSTQSPALVSLQRRALCRHWTEPESLEGSQPHRVRGTRYSLDQATKRWRDRVPCTSTGDPHTHLHSDINSNRTSGIPTTRSTSHVRRLTARRPQTSSCALYVRSVWTRT